MPTRDELQSAIQELSTVAHQYLNAESDEAVVEIVIEQSLANAINLAITALRQHKKTEPCEWCEIASFAEYEVTYFKDCDRWATTKSIMPNYCPNCGRKLEG